MREIARRERLSLQFVFNWTRSPHQDMTVDHRGWRKGIRRIWTKETERRIKELHSTLVGNPAIFFAGPSAIIQEWRKQYPDASLPSLRMIGAIMNELGLSEKRKKGRSRGASRYLCYPEYTIYEMFPGRIIESDFVGKKYLAGRTAPVHFVGFSAKKEPRLRYFQRVEAETADCLIAACTAFFQRYEKPNFLKVDNGAAMSGSQSAQRSVSRTMAFLLQRQIVPIFSVPKRPFSQASIEGNNSVFARFFWNKRRFASLGDLDTQLGWFNENSRAYYRYVPPERYAETPFIPRVYFIRQVQEETTPKRTRGYIDVLNEHISLPKAYIKYFVLVEWMLLDEKLNIYFEKEQKSSIIRTLSFPINLKSRYQPD